MSSARPVQAALASAATFSIGALLPILTVALVPFTGAIRIVTVLSLLFLAVLGMIAAQAGGASPVRGAVRVTFWGAPQWCSLRWSEGTSERWCDDRPSWSTDQRTSLTASLARSINGASYSSVGMKRA